MTKKKQIVYFFLSIILILFSFGIILQGDRYANSNIQTSADLSNLVFDGIIEEDEWTNAEINKSFYLDVDNTPDSNGHINVDGNNTIYVGQDSQNIYIALDLWGDRSNLSTGEWIGAWFNFNNRSFNNYYDWFYYLGNGTESLIHDVDDDRIWPYYSPVLDDDYEDFRNDEGFSLIEGYSDSDYTHFLPHTGKDFNITSELMGSTYKYRMDFSIKLSDITILPNSSEVLEDITIRIQSYSNVSIDNNQVAIWDGNDLPNLGNSDYVKDIDVGVGNVYDAVFDNVNYGLGNLTGEDEIKFSFLGNNSAAFKFSVHSLRFEITSNETTNPGGIKYPYTSLINQEVKWSFGPSPENATAHRMFEIKIAKNEFKQYDLSKGIGFMVGGYGTLSFENTNYWVLSKNPSYFTIFESDDYLYLDISWLSESDTQIPGYNVFIILTLIGIVSLVFYKKYK